MKFPEKKMGAATSRTPAWLGVTLLALALTGIGATAFPINLKQDKNEQEKNVEATKRFVGRWGNPRPGKRFGTAYVFKMEGNQLKVAVPVTEFADARQTEVIREEHLPLPDPKVEGRTLTWKDKWDQPGHEVLVRITLITDDEILVESVGKQRSNDQPTLVMPVSFKLVREK